MTLKHRTERSSAMSTKLSFLGSFRSTLRRFGLAAKQERQEEVDQGGSDKESSSRKTGSSSSTSISRSESQAQPILTDGPCRVVSASDGRTECLALLLTRETVERINEMMKIQKNVDDMKKEMKRHEEELQYAEDVIQAIQEMTNGQDESQKDEGHMTRLAETQKTRDETEIAIDRLKPDLEIGLMDEESTRNRYFYEVCNALEEASLIKPVEDKVIEESASIQSQELESEKSESSVVTLEELNRRVAKESMNFWDIEIERCQEDFNNRHSFYCTELEGYQQALADKRTSWTQSNFDRFYFTEVQGLTRNLIDAEENFRQARTYAREVGALPAENDFEQESDFFDHPDDGYRESLEASWASAAPRDSIEAWLDRIVQGTSHDPPISFEESVNHAMDQFEQETREVDDWDVRSVGFASSIGVLDHGPNRRNIKRWREICEGWRKEQVQP